jgi:PPOX class probable F420-dependent enzyme
MAREVVVPERIPESHLDLIEGPVFVTLATIMPNGQPQLTVVWCTYDEPYVLVNTTRRRQKTRNVERNPKVSIMAIDPENRYRYLEVRGRVEELTEQGARDLIDELARLYADVPAYYGHVAPAEQADKETRVILKIRPTRVRAHGG